MKYADFRATIKECPFCITDKSANRKLLENDTAYVTFAIAPYHPDHILVVPKRHIVDILDVTDEELRDLNALQKKSLQILNRLGHRNISILVREGKETGQTVSHIHYHMLPHVKLGNTDYAGDDRKIMSEEEIQALISRIEAVK